jgi:ABC transporter substrate binding protein
MSTLRRREFVALLGGAAAAWPLAARAQQPVKLPTIGFLGAASASGWSQWVAAFVQRLRELGWIEGRNLTIEYRLELLREVVPRLRRLAILANIAYPASVIEMSEVQAAASKLGLEVVALEIQRAEDITPALMALNDRAEALYVTADPLLNVNRIRIYTLANIARLPTIANVREYVEAGGLMSYGPNYPDLFRRAADFVHKILHGAKPGDIPVEQPTKFDLVINVAIAKAQCVRFWKMKAVVTCLNAFGQIECTWQALGARS